MKTGGRAANDNPTTWCDYYLALGMYKRRDCAGVGLCRTGDYIFIDLDGVLDADENLLPQFPWASKILDVVSCRAYIEKSVSGTGIHVVCRGKLPPNGRKFELPGNNHVGYEFCDKSRYFTFTGAVLPQSGAICDLTEELAALHRELFPPKPKLNGSGNHARHITHPYSLGDEELLGRARRAANGPAFCRLWDGDASDYASQSEADLALCCHLAFWTGKDASRMDVLFRQSGLYREKWERHDYRERTIEAAIEQTSDTYNPNHNHPAAESSYVVSVVSVVPPTDEERASAADGKAEGASETTKSTGSNWPQGLKDEAFHGPAGELVRAIEPHSEADPAAILIQFLVAFGNLIGRSAHFVVEADRHFMNLFIAWWGRRRKDGRERPLGKFLEF